METNLLFWGKMGHYYYSLDFINAIIFSILIAKDMSPLIFNFPDMKAIVGFKFPVKIYNQNVIRTLI